MHTCALSQHVAKWLYVPVLCCTSAPLHPLPSLSLPPVPPPPLPPLCSNVSKHVSRPILLAAACACMSVAHLILMIGQLQLLALGVVVTGLSYGAYWSLGPW